MIILSKFLEHEEESDINLFLLIVYVGWPKSCFWFFCKTVEKPEERALVTQ